MGVHGHKCVHIPGLESVEGGGYRAHAGVSMEIQM